MMDVICQIIWLCFIVLISLWSGYVFGHSKGMDDYKERISRMVVRLRPNKEPYKNDSDLNKAYHEGFDNAKDDIRFWMI